MDCCFVTSKTAGRGPVWVWLRVVVKSRAERQRAAAVGFLLAARHAGGAQSLV